MSNGTRWRRATAAMLLLAGAILSVGIAFGQVVDVRVGMSMEQVVRLLGEPDRKGVLVGKELKDAAQVAGPDLAQRRLAYIYESSRLQVWFWDGKVTGVTRYGVSLQ